MFASIGRFSYRRRRGVVAVWLVAFSLGLVGSSQLHHKLRGGGFADPASPSQRAATAMQDRLHMGVSMVTIVFTSSTLDARGAEFQALVAQALSRYTVDAVPSLVAVRTAKESGDASLVSRDGHASMAVLFLATPIERAQNDVPHIRALLVPTGLTTYFVGEPALYNEMETVSTRDLRTAETYTLPFALLVLVLIFGTLVAAGLPVIGGGVAVTVTLGALWGLAHVFEMSIYTMNVASLLGLGIGIDYALFMVGRFREELAGGATVADAIETTVARAGRSIFFSGVAVMVGLLGLVFYPYMSLRSMGLGGSLVVFFSVATALTLLPAVMGILGPRINSLHIFYRPGREGRFWRAWSDRVMEHPVLVLVLTLALVAAIAWPVKNIVTDVPSAASMPQDSEVRRGYDILNHDFDPSALSPIDVLVTWPGDSGALDAANIERNCALARQLQALPGVREVQSVVSLKGITDPGQVKQFWRLIDRPPEPQASSGSDVTSPLGLISGAFGDQVRRAAEQLRSATTAPGTLLLRVVPTDDPSSPGAQELAHHIQTLPPPPGTTLQVGGISAGLYDYLNGLFSRFPWIILFVVVVTYFVLLVLLRSVLLPLKAVIVNLFSLLASYGVLVWVFQYGHLQWLFDFKSTGGVDADLPVLLFCTAFGVSMDYEVFLMSRMREAWLETGDNKRSVGFGLASTGRIVTSAALIVAVVAGSFTLTSIVITKALGVGMAVAVLLDATVIRLLMVPAAMRLLGRWNWWLPAWLDRRLPQLGGH